jgi:hypothetical protein
MVKKLFGKLVMLSLIALTSMSFAQHMEVVKVVRITVNHKRTIEEMVKAGNYYRSDPYITSKHFPSSEKGLRQVETRIVQFNRYVVAKEVLQELDNNGFRPATLPELLALGEQYPGLQEFPIVALGSIWYTRAGYRHVAYLDRDRNLSRELLLYGVEYGWNSKWGGDGTQYYFAAVRK